MAAFEYDENDLPFLKEQKFLFRIDQPEKGLFRMQCGTMTLTSLPAVPGEYPETMALTKKQRTHESADGSECSLETESSIPFGTEPEICRLYSFCDGRMTVRTDFVLRHGFEMRHLSAGGFRVDGVKHFKISSVGPQAGAPIHDKTMDFLSQADGSVFYDKAQAPLLLRLVGMDKEPIEFELGAALWRWDIPARLPGRARFIIRKEGESLVFLWNLYEFASPAPEAVPPHGRNIRYVWSLRYAPPASGKKPFKAVFDTVNFKWPESACVKGKDGNALPLPCFRADKTIFELKSWLRSQLAGVQEGDVFAVLVPAEDSICCDAAHEDRARKEQLVHWDREGKLDFQKWANRQLFSKGARLIIQYAEGEKKK